MGSGARRASDASGLALTPRILAKWHYAVNLRYYAAMPDQTEVKLTIRMDRELHAQLVALAAKEDRSLNAQIVRMLRSSLAEPAPRSRRPGGAPVGTLKLRKSDN